MSVGTRITNIKVLSELRISTMVIDTRTGTIFRIVKRDGEVALLDFECLDMVTREGRPSKTAGNRTPIDDVNLFGMDLVVCWEPPVVTLDDIRAMIGD